MESGFLPPYKVEQIYPYAIILMNQSSSVSNIFSGGID
jgi:hypothetical protein